MPSGPTPPIPPGGSPRRERRRYLIGAVVAGLALAALLLGLPRLLGEGAEPARDASAGGFAARRALPTVRLTDLTAAAEAAGCTVTRQPSEGREHVEGEVDYRANPPTSGPHHPVAAEEGVYAEAPPTEALVHSLEHGRVVVQFDPDLPLAVRADLRALYNEDPYHVLLTPNDTDMPFAVAATAWRHTLACPKAGERVFDAIRAFRDRYRDRGPERVP